MPKPDKELTHGPIGVRLTEEDAEKVARVAKELARQRSGPVNHAAVIREFAMPRIEEFLAEKPPTPDPAA